ncbi:rubrerythrin [Desulfitispora alkaliphila]|uniref:rubrerythrin family protein n=1 Tax=Desulfitispora alkaliphila TaxID=622674 RepID=UPI003D197640
MSDKTFKNAMAAFAGESQARNKYTFFAKVARSEGKHWLADIFEETADHERKHAEILLKLVKGLGNTEENLQAALEGETYEHEDMYPKFAAEAREEGNEEAAQLFEELAKVEKAHAERYEALLKLVKANKRPATEEKVTWRCKVCGYIVEDNVPVDICPLCKHSHEFYRPEAEAFKS